MSYQQIGLSLNQVEMPNFIHCPITETNPDVKNRGGTYKYPWFDPLTDKNGGFFVPVPDDDYDKQRGRPAPPSKKLKKFGKRFTTTKATRVQPNGEILKGYYCELGRLEHKNPLF